MKPTKNHTTVKLSTPHGALGTSHIPNIKNKIANLSTPHGALGTNLRIGEAFVAFVSFQLHTVH